MEARSPDAALASLSMFVRWSSRSLEVCLRSKWISSSAEEVKSSQESQFHHNVWWFVFFTNALEETFKFLDSFRIDWPSCLKVMMYCRFSLLSWAVLAIICWDICCIPQHNTTNDLLTFNKTHLLIENNEAGWDITKKLCAKQWQQTVGI